MRLVRQIILSTEVASHGGGHAFSGSRLMLHGLSNLGSMAQVVSASVSAGVLSWTKSPGKRTVWVGGLRKTKL